MSMYGFQDLVCDIKSLNLIYIIFYGSTVCMYNTYAIICLRQYIDKPVIFFLYTCILYSTMN